MLRLSDQCYKDWWNFCRSRDPSQEWIIVETRANSTPSQPTFLWLKRPQLALKYSFREIKEVSPCDVPPTITQMWDWWFSCLLQRHCGTRFREGTMTINWLWHNYFPSMTAMSLCFLAWSYIQRLDFNYQYSSTPAFGIDLLVRNKLGFALCLQWCWENW